MKKIIALMLSLMMLVSFTACSDREDIKDGASSSDGINKNDDVIPSDGETESDADINSDAEKNEAVDTENKADEGNKEEKPVGNKPAENKPSESKPSEDKPQSKPEASKPGQTPAPQPESKPQTKPESSAKTIGTTLLADFNSKAASYSDAKSLAEAISKNSVIEFMPVVEAAAPGLLTGFGNAQIDGFKEAAKFAPMIGTIPFVGYVFVLEDGASASAFIAKLKSNANPNWNVCSTADETITGSVGNKVFFVMSPKNFEE